MKGTVPLTAFVIAASVVSLRGQAPDQKPLAFEVASIKPNTSGRFDWQIFTPKGSEFTTTNVPLERLITWAFSVRDEQMINLPSWASSERFDIAAKYPKGTAFNLRGAQEMLRTLLAERFTLHTHHETRELPVYLLVLALRDRQLGPFLRPSTKATPFPFAPGVTGAHDAPINLLTIMLSGMAGRLVLDRTDLPGNYDYELHWTPGPAPGVSTDSNNPSIFTVVEEQLGLKLEPSKAPVDVLVIDHVERPTPD